MLLAIRKCFLYVAAVTIGKLSGRRRSDCPIAVALDIFGDSWSLLIIRDLMLKGRKTFQDFLEAEEKIATNVLSDRLARLERQEILLKERDPNDARRFIYRLTEKGIALAPILVEMILWSARYEKTAAPPAQIRQISASKERFIASIRASWEKGAPQ